MMRGARPWEKSGLTRRKRKDPLEYPQLPYTPILRKGSQFLRQEIRWPYKGLIVGTDPVAVDAVGPISSRQNGSHFRRSRALDVPPIHIVVADQKYHLGVSD